MSYRSAVFPRRGADVAMIVKSSPFAGAAFAVALAVACGMAGRSLGQTTPQFGIWGFDLTGMDTKNKPGDNFSDYANGTWDARTAIPADKSRISNFDLLRDKSEERL